MKNLLLLGVLIICFTSCEKQKQRYFAESAETKTLEAGIVAYESGDWEKWRSHFADTAKIYVNSKDPITLAERRTELSAMTEAFSSYGFDKDNDYIEMVLDKDDEIWVYYWAQHSGTMVNGTELSMPVHLAVQFTEGKITEEHIYFDATAMNAALTAMQNELEAEASEEQ
ncbi:nuclear transport factor 2 family protein [Winogradskyella alexanderae]|uniref:Nuclear transport factor 2 family protein n=1 Tax=Winogradskyella alexanderae TaxID=2877123 RepID=A0ABS7XTT5_9FLAO|nr:nuclear transport factor 2 family protein [Winogradskyella alexanderae]MCA0133438.1 nuclear transport factor 2 family protein [Winogradskyella alexanderae]